MPPPKPKKIRRVKTAGEVIIQKAWFLSLLETANEFEKHPTDVNKAILLGFISSAKFIVTHL